MKTNFRLFFVLGLILTVTCHISLGQVGINNNGTLPDSSAGLDVNFNNKGILPPRLTFEQRNGIFNPAEGLMVFCTNCNSDGTGGVSVFQSGSWKMVALNCYTPIAPSSGIHIVSPTQTIWNWNTVHIALGYKWNIVNDYSSTIDMGTFTSKTETGIILPKEYFVPAWTYDTPGI